MDSKSSIRHDSAVPASSAQKKFGDRVRLLRTNAGLTQEALAAKCGLDRSYIGSVERGERNISLENICRIAAAIGVEAKELFAGWTLHK